MRAGPLPRLRIYTALGQYGRVLGEMLSGRANAGDSVAAFEGAVARLVGAPHAVAMPMARTAIYLTLKNLIRPGQKVIVSPYTIADVINMVICAGGIPVFADIERHTCNIDPAEIARLIDGETGAVLVTHFYGLMCDMPAISPLCRERGVPLVEDAAQCFGGRLGGRHAGTFGDAGIFSFGMYKNVNSFLGGMVVTGRRDLGERLQEEVGRLPYYAKPVYLRKVMAAAMTDVVTLPVVFRNLSFRIFRYAFLNGIDAINNKLKIDLDPAMRREMPVEYLFRMTPLQARLGLEQLARVEPDMQRRIHAARKYHSGLRDIPQLLLPPLREDGSHIYWYFPIQYDDRKALVRYAMEHGRDISESYHRNCAELACFAEFRRPCPNARATANALIYLPTYPRYSDDEIEKTIAVIRRFFGR